MATKKKATKKKSGHGGARAGAGRKPRVAGMPRNSDLVLSFTSSELAALERERQARAPEVPLSRWLADTLLAAWLQPCDLCGAIAYDRDWRPLYGPQHVCGEVKGA